MTTPPRFPVAPALAALFLAACGAGAPPPAAPADGVSAPLAIAEAGPVVARVDGVPIHAALLEAMARGRNLDLGDAAQRQRAVDELVDYALLTAAARTRPELAADAVRADIELAALMARANAVMARLGAVTDPTEAELQAEYDRQAELNGGQEYAVAHLLFDDEAAALDAAGAVLAGRAFADVQGDAANRAKQAVDLGWVKLGQLPPEFAQALRGLAPGATTQVPVQTAYGWHVIHLREARPFTPPPFEQVREGIRRMLVANASRSAIQALRSEARIELPQAR